MEPAEIIGLIAGSCLAISNIPQIVRILKTKDTTSISFLMYLIYTTGIILWLTYGVILSSISVIISNSIALTTASVVLIFKFMNIIVKKEKI